MKNLILLILTLFVFAVGYNDSGGVKPITDEISLQAATNDLNVVNLGVAPLFESQSFYLLNAAEVEISYGLLSAITINKMTDEIFYCNSDADNLCTNTVEAYMLNKDKKTNKGFDYSCSNKLLTV